MKKSNRCHKASRELEGAESSVSGRLDVGVGFGGVGSCGGNRGDGVLGHGGRLLGGKQGRGASAVSNVELAGLGKDGARVAGRAGAHQVDLVVLAERESSAGRRE